MVLTMALRMNLTMNQEKPGNSDFFLTLLMSKPELPFGLFQQILLFYSNKKGKYKLNPISIIQDIFQEVIKKIDMTLAGNEDEIINKDQAKIYEESKALLKNTDLTINFHKEECGEMKAHSRRFQDVQIYLPVFVGNNSKENIFSSEILHKYQLLIRELLMCKFVDINPALPMSVFVAYLILSSITINDAEGKKVMKFWILKYSYNNAADRLLSISHDVEKNPGPVRQTFSEKLRPVTKKLCTQLLKVFERKQTKKSPNNLWTTEAGFYLYDHSNEKIYSCTYKIIEIEALIDILIACCKEQECDISELCEEVTAWGLCDFNKLFHLHSISTAIEKVNSITSNIARILQYVKKVAIDEKMVELGIQLNYTSFHIWLSINPTEEERKKADLCWEACRYITSALCKQVNKESKMGKYASPPDWSAEYEKFQNPYNEKGGHDIKIFFKDLLDYCSKRDQGNWIPQEFKSYIKACEAWIKDHKQQKDLLQEYVLHHEVTVIKENLRPLQSDCSLCNVTSMLEERGIYFLSDNCRTVSLQSDPASTSRKRKLKDSETTEKKYVKMPRNNVEISELETAQKNMAILKATDAKVSPKERKLRTKMEIWIKITLNGEPIKVITHGYNPDFSKFKEVQHQDALQKQENASFEEIKDEYLYENAMVNKNVGNEQEEITNHGILNPRDITNEKNDCEYTIDNFATTCSNESEIIVSEIPELEDYTEISTIKPVNATDDKFIHNPLPSLYKNDCVQKSRHSIKCPVESEFCTDIKISGTYQSSEINQLYNCSSPEMRPGTSSPDAYIHKAVTEENSANTASNDNNPNNEYHDDNMFDDNLLNNFEFNNEDIQSLSSIFDNGNIMNWDSTIDLIDSLLADSNIVTRGSSSSINGQSYNDDNHLISDQSTNFPDIDFLYVENTN